MVSNKRLSDLTSYAGVLPYASELFGVYQPLLGWKSSLAKSWLWRQANARAASPIDRFATYFQNHVPISVNGDCFVEAEGLQPADFRGPRLREQTVRILVEIRQALAKIENSNIDENLHHVVNEDGLTALLRGPVLQWYNDLSLTNCRRMAAQNRRNPEEMQLRRDRNASEVTRALASETEIAGALIKLAAFDRFDLLRPIFYDIPAIDGKTGFERALESGDANSEDPLLFFDPKKDAGNIALSPIGITHLFRQYFFELDTFLGTPVSHVWMSPGSTVELIEVSTRRVMVERTIEEATETTEKRETSATTEDEISEAVKQDNKDDLKLGVTSTVNQSWGTGNVTATASLNLDKTQSNARENTHKRMRQQTEKLSSEIRKSYKSTFKTVTETTDLASKRYVLANNSGELINYELRRKMRQVAVQVQDIGSYLSWDTFIDEPGMDLGLANLVHIAQPADLLPVLDQTMINYPADQVLTFRSQAVWNWGDNRKYGFVPLTTIDPPPAPEGFEVVLDNAAIPVAQISGEGEDFNGIWWFEGHFTSTGQITLGVVTAPDGLKSEDPVNFVLGGAVRARASATKRAEIDAANAARRAAANLASAENDRKTRDAFIKAAKDRIELASGITKRKAEDLREEERIIVYRRLIRMLMTDAQYSGADDRSRHVLSQLINTIFDVDKMLYFVAPEWWKPHERARLALSPNDLSGLLDGSVVNWKDSAPRPSNYLITDKSLPAAKGSSLGWLLQLDGDDLRNAFLNAPWVKAVIPIRPSKEQAAISWLSNAGVEGSDGLSAGYIAPVEELGEIRDKLGLAPGSTVTLLDAINDLCQRVAAKHAEGNAVRAAPETEISDDNKVMTTPIEKVYEHGFYPLQGGFRIAPAAHNPDPNNVPTNYQVFDQWIEILPTDQVVPVEVKYDRKTGRQI